MKFPYALLSDQHCFEWSQYASRGADGVNTRLAMILSEMKRAAHELVAAGGDTMIFAGDLFHTRGSITPGAFNPTHTCIEDMIEQIGVKIVAIPGNHDLASKDTTELGNAMQTLNSLKGFTVASEPFLFGSSGEARALLIPWHSTTAGLKEAVANAIAFFKLTAAEKAEIDLIIHAPVNGVLAIPDHGFEAKELASWGFKTVFSGHYHNHRVLEGGKVVSVGATTHQQPQDLGTKAGFLLVYKDKIDYRASHAPNFVEITGATDPDDYPVIVDGNFVRVTSIKLTDRQVNELRAVLIKDGAKGVSFNHEKVSTVTARTGSIASPTQTLEQSVDAFVLEMKIADPGVEAEVSKRAALILSDVRARAA